MTTILVIMCVVMALLIVARIVLMILWYIVSRS